MYQLIHASTSLGKFGGIIHLTKMHVSGTDRTKLVINEGELAEKHIIDIII